MWMCPIISKSEKSIPKTIDQHGSFRIYISHEIINEYWEHARSPSTNILHVAIIKRQNFTVI